MTAPVPVHQRLEIARKLYADGLGNDDVAVKLFGRADGITMAAARELRREIQAEEGGR